MIADLQTRVKIQEERGYDIVYVDQCVFSTSSLKHQGKAWGPAADPIQFKPGVGGGSFVSVMAGASLQNGLVYWEKIVGRAYKKEDVWAFLKNLKKRYGRIKFAVFLDNASIHSSDATRSVAFDLGVPLIFNMPYRPAFNGIENMWGHAKEQYRKVMKDHKFRG